MPPKTRDERVEEYRRQSLQADALVASGGKDEALKLLERARADAEKADDTDYRLFFAAELVNYTSPDYARQIALVGDALEWSRRRGHPPDHFLTRCLGTYSSLSGDEETAISWYQKALDISPRDSDAMRGMGVSWFKRGHEDTAISWYEKALEENPADAAAHRGRSITAYSRGDAEAALRHIAEATRLAPGRYDGEFRAICRALGRDVDQEWKRLVPPRTPVPAQDAGALSDLRAFIVSVREAYGGRIDRFLSRKEEWERTRKDFLLPESLLDPGRSLLMVLRKWNSYTPAIPSAGEERGRGGGYFLWHQGRGLVIDPGYDFLGNFARAGGRLRDIDAILLTHSHNDHTAEFETLRMLFHEYNHQDGIKEPKRVRFLVSNRCLVKFSGTLDIHHTGFTESLITLNPECEHHLGEGIRLRVLPAFHDEQLSLDQATGLLLAMGASGWERRILFTGDTGLFPLRPGPEKAVSDTRGGELWERYPKEGKEPLRPDLMVAHIGSIKKDEFKLNLDEDPGAACYPGHLGVLGVARLLTRCRPRLAVVSEFGEEMASFRVDLIRALQEKVIDKACEGDPVERIPRVLPGDIPFLYDLSNGSVYCCDTREWIDGRSVSFGECKCGEEGEACIYYYRNGQPSDRDAPRFADRFWHNVTDHDGLYFRES